MTITSTPIENGVNVEALLDARAAFADNPEIAQFQWRSSVTWVNGTHSRSDVESFYGFADEQVQHRQMLQEVVHPVTGPMAQVRNPMLYGVPLDAGDAPPLHGYVDLYDGPRHLATCLIVATGAGEDGERAYEFKVRMPVADHPAADFERTESAPAALIPRSF